MKRFDKTLHAAGTVKRARRLRNSMTSPEKALWKTLRKAGLHARVLRFRNQQVLDDPESVVDAILKSLPPRWGKGRDGGASAAVPGFAHEAGPPPVLNPQPITRTPTQPSPIEGEGFGVVVLEGEGFPGPDISTGRS